MAIEKTVRIKSIKYNAEKTLRIDLTNEPKFLLVEKEIVIDDPDDAELPMVKADVKRYEENDDVSNEDVLVQQIFNLIFPK